MGDGPARAARRRRRLVQGVRAGAGVRAATDVGALRALAGPRRRGARPRRAARVAAPRRRRHADRRVRQPAGGVACRSTAVRRAPAWRGGARTRASRARRPGPARRDAARRATRTCSQRDLPLEGDEIGRLGRLPPRFAELCAELAAPACRRRFSTTTSTWRTSTSRATGCGCSTGATRRSRTRSRRSSSRSASSRRATLPPGDPWFARLRDAYLEPWGRGLADAFALALRVGTFAHTFAWTRHRDYLPQDARRNSTSGSVSCCVARSLGRSSRRRLPVGLAVEAAAVVSRLAGAVRVHDVELGVAVALAREDDLGSSGDQAGSSSSPSLVSCVTFAPSAFIAKISYFEPSLTPRR